MNYRAIFLASLMPILAACANPLNQVTSDNYADMCASAERNGRLDVAEQACYRALVNVDMGNLGPVLKSQRLYNLALIKRRLAKFGEAADLLRESLKIEEQLSGPRGLPSARRNVELAVNVFAERKYDEAATVAEKVLPVADGFSGREREFAKRVITEIGKKLEELGRREEARRFMTAADSL